MMNAFFRIQIIILILFPFVCIGSDNLELRRYEVFCNPVEYQHILDHSHEDIYIPCDFRYNGNTYSNVEIRLRGDSSRDYPKKSYKIKFSDDRPFLEREKLNLASCWLDPSFVREYLSYEFFRRAGIPCSRTWFAEFYINNDYIGLYLDIEQVDELVERFNFSDSTSVYKASRDGALLNYDEDFEALWEKKRLAETGFYDLIDLSNYLRLYAGSDFFDKINNKFDRDHLAHIIAINAIICNSSTYYHNYYLFHELTAGGKWHYVPWDMDRSHHIIGGASYLPTFFSTTHHTRDKCNPLILNSWRDERMRPLIFQHMSDILDNLVTNIYYNNITNTLENLLTESVHNDLNKRYTNEEFHAAINNIGNELLARKEFLAEVMQNAYPPLFYLDTPRMTSEGILFQWHSLDPTPSDTHYHVAISDNYAFDNALSFDTGTDSTFLLTNIPDFEKFYWYVDAINSNGTTGSLQYFAIFTPSTTSLATTHLSGIINESMTLSGNIFIDEAIQIPENITLTFQAGSTLFFSDNSHISVNGAIRFNGTSTSPITFIPAASEPIIGHFSLSGRNAFFFADHVNIPDRCYCDADTPFFAATESAELALNSVHINHMLSPFLATNSAVVTIDSCNFKLAADSLLILQNSQLDLSESELISLSTQSNVAFFANNSSTTINNCILQQDSGILYHGKDNSELSISRSKLSGTRNSSAFSIANSAHALSVSNSSFNNFNIVFDIINSDQISIYNNVFFGNLSLVSSNNTAINIYNSILFNNKSFGSSSFVISHYNFLDNMPQEDATIIHNQFARLNVIDPWNNNYFPLSNSSLIDAAYGTNYPERDISSHIRIDDPFTINSGGGLVPYVDIGIYEYRKGSPKLENLLSMTDKKIWCYPNPSGSTTTIAIRSKENTTIQLVIYNVLGQLVYKTSFHNINDPLVLHSWDGRNLDGDSVSSGIYIIEATVNGDIYRYKHMRIK